MYNQSVELFKRHHYQEALEGFKQCTAENFDQDIILSSYNYILTIFKHLEMATEWENYFEKFIHFLDSKKRYREINEEFRDYQFNKKNNKIRLLNFAWKASLEVGEIKRSNEFAHQLIDHYISRKNFAQGIRLIEMISSRVKIDREMILKISQLYLMKGDGEQATEKLMRGLERKIIHASDVVKLEKLFKLNELRRTSYTTSLLYIQLQLENALSRKDISVRGKKNLINTLYLGFLFNPANPQVLYGLLVYAVENQKKKIFENVSQICRTQKINWKSYREIKVRIDDLIATAHDFKDEESLVWEEDVVDMATDLFSSENTNKKAMADVQRRMERAIEFLQEIGEETKAMELFHQEEKQRVFVGDSEFKDLSIDEIEQDLQSILQKFKSQLPAIDPALNEASSEFSDDRLRAYIKNGGIDLSSSNYRDIVIALSQMGLDGAAWEVISQYESSETIDELVKRIEFNYLKVEVLRKLNRFGEAIALLKEMLDTWALDHEELVCFHYLAAETYRDNGIPERALYHYRMVAQLAPNYRLVEQRIVELV